MGDGDIAKVGSEGGADSGEKIPRAKIAEVIFCATFCLDKTKEVAILETDHGGGEGGREGRSEAMGRVGK